MLTRLRRPDNQSYACPLNDWTFNLLCTVYGRLNTRCTKNLHLSVAPRIAYASMACWIWRSRELGAMMKSNIAIRVEHGMIQEVVSDDRALSGSRVAIVEGDKANRVVTIQPADALTDLMNDAGDRTICEGIGIAAELAGERIMSISKRRYNDPRVMTRELTDVLTELVEMTRKALASQ